MFRLSAALCLGILSTLKLSAQTPAYHNSSFPNASHKASFKCSSCGTGFKWQSIIAPSDIPGASDGAVQSIYLHLDTTEANAFFPELKIKLGYTNKFAHPLLPTNTDTFATNLTTVVDLPSYTFSSTNAVGSWIRFTLAPGAFSYRTDSNLVLEVSRGPANVNLSLMATTGNSPTYAKTIGADRAAATLTPGSPPMGTIPEELDFGLDMVPSGIDRISNIVAAGLFPNPARGGYFMFSLETKQPVKSLDVILTNTIGRTVRMQKPVQPTRNTLLKFSTQGLAAGVYVLQASADEERLVQRVVVE